MISKTEGRQNKKREIVTYTYSFITNFFFFFFVWRFCTWIGNEVNVKWVSTSSKLRTKSVLSLVLYKLHGLNYKNY